MGIKLTTETFKLKAALIHDNKYIYNKTIYTNHKIKVKIICPIHGEFEQNPSKHLQKKGCAECGFISRCDKARSSSKEFIVKAVKVHGTKFKYSNVVYSGRDNKVDIICEIHGIFKQTPHNHLKGHGCSICCESKGEIDVKNYLIKNNFKFLTQKRFKDCRNILPLPFDFYLPDLNICIEYQGIQHFKPRSKFGGKKGFEKTIKRDLIKEKYCEDNNISLIKISYKENVEDILDKFI